MSHWCPDQRIMMWMSNFLYLFFQEFQIEMFCLFLFFWSFSVEPDKVLQVYKKSSTKMPQEA